MKKLLALFMLLAVLATMVACNDEEEPAGPADVGAEGWAAMLAEDKFSNYSFTMSGTMTSTQGGESYTSYAKETVKFANNKVAIGFFEDENDTEADWQTLDGELAAAQRVQMTQIFMTLLEEYARYAYDANTNSYKLANTVTIDTVLKGFMMDEHGNISPMDVPAVIEMRNGEVFLSDDGRLVKFVCDYSQKMNGDQVSISGITTWEFFDYGTTVVE